MLVAASPYGWMVRRWRRYGDIFSSRFPIFGRVVYVADPALVKEVFTGDPLTGPDADITYNIPPLPAGEYRLYADVVHESGFTQTLVDTVAIPEALAGAEGLDPDDSWLTTVPDGEAGGVTLADGSRMVWEGSPTRLTAGQELELRFMVYAPDGTLGIIQPPSLAVATQGCFM